MKGTYAIKDYFSPEFELLHCAGEIAVVHDTATDERVDGDRYAALGVGAFVGVPLIRQDKWRFYFSLLDSKPHDWRNNEIELLRELTTRIWTRLERARAEVALRQSEAKYRSLFDSIDEGFAIAEVIYDSAGQPVDLLYLEANPAASRLTGVPDYTGRRLSEFSPDFKSYWVELYDRVAKSGVSERTEQYAAPLNRWYDFYVFRVEAAEPSGSCQVAVVFQDITERKLHERQQKFLLQLSDALRPIADPIAIQETTSRMAAEHLDIGRVAYCEIRYEPDIVVIVEHDWPRRGMPLIAAGRYRMSDFGSFLAEEFAAGRPAIVADVATDPRIPPTDRENWSVFEITASCGLPVIKEGRFVAYLVAQDNQPHDWTDREIELLRELSERTWAAVERARAEAALRESEQRLSVIFAQAAVGLSEISLDGHFEQVNDALCRMLGRSRQELLAATVPQVTHPEDISKSLDALAQLLETGESISLDKRYLRSDDTVFWANSILTRLDDEHGQPRHILAVTVDLSDRKQAEANQMQLIREQSAREEERQRAESLAELNRAKTAFFSNVSHEFRTPLTLSLAPLQDALSDRTHPLDPVHRERLELVHHNSLRLLKLVNTLLDFSRIEAGRMEAVYEPTDLATYTAELASVFRSAIERAGLQLVIDCPPLPEPVFVDREMWEKIVLNLLSNAFKFTFEGEIRVELRMKNKECRMKTNQNSEFSIPTSQFPYVQLTISDTGAGIAPEHLPHLFERFYQVRGTQARTHEGSGIGLALVNELVQLQGGTIEVSSTVGEGTYFTVSLLLGTDHLPSERLRRDGTGHLQDEGAPRSGSVPGRQPVRTLASTAMRATTYVEEAERWLPAEGNREWGMGNGEEVSTPPPSSLLPPPPLAHVLVVDDNADMREYLTRILSEHVPVEAVADGATALAVAQERVPDLILSDVMMPGLDGFELLETLRADPLTRDIPIILLSARAGEEAIVEGLEAGADDYLIKPFSAQELVSRVTAHLQMAQLRGEALQEARSTLRSRDEFISVISHELNTPLVSILGWTRMLRSSPSNPVMLNKALDTIERNATLQGKLVQDLLDLSRISAGKLHLNPQPIELKPVIETAIATVAQPAADKGINLIWQDAVTEPIVVKGDSDRLQQVICNLLTNAIKFTPEAGSVRVELSVEEGGVREYEGEISPNSLLSHSPTLPYAQITITDTGIGIAANFLPYVFERFRQAQGAHSTKGLGLGLAIAHHIVELHNGTIHADSAGEGRGATFTVRLPLLQDGES
ncbi:response regulator [Oscillatoria sp. FACHB-1407]|nr:response regulator [Oscillatoria sp. FACHB-1407]